MEDSKPNIVVALMDTARTDRFSCYGNSRDTTPFIDSLAKGGTRYEEAYSTSIWSLPAYVSLFNGKLPNEHGILSWSPGADNTLISSLSDYKTLCVSPHVMGGGWGLVDDFDVHENISVPHRRPLITPDPVLDDMQGKGLDAGAFIRSFAEHRSPQTLLNAPYQLFRKQILYRLGFWDDSGATDVINRSKEVVSDADNPFFLFMNFVESHKPMYLPQEWALKWTNESAHKVNKATTTDLFDITFNDADFPQSQQEIFVDVHDASLAYQDKKIEEFYRYLESEGEAENTVFIILSDHGNLFGERGIWGHHAYVDRNVCRVPLLIRYPWDSPDTVSDPVSIINVYETMLEIADGRPDTITPDSEVFVEYAGYDEETLKANDVPVEPWSYYQISCVSDEWKLNWRADGNTELYNLNAPSSEVSQTNPDVIAQLKEAVRDEMGTPDELHERLGTGTEIEDLTDDTLQHLKSMGYLKGENA